MKQLENPGLNSLYNLSVVDENRPNVNYDNLKYSYNAFLETCDNLIKIKTEITKEILIAFSKAVEAHVSYMNNVISKITKFKEHDTEDMYVIFRKQFKEAIDDANEYRMMAHKYVFNTVELLLTVNTKAALTYARRSVKHFESSYIGLGGKTVVVVINGYNQVGKDTFIDLFTDITKEKVHNISTVDMVKVAAYTLGWNGEKNENAREALHEIKKIGNKYFDHSRTYVKDFIRKHTGSFIFVHCREPEEIAWLVENVPKMSELVECKTLLIKNDRVEAANNYADQSVLNYLYDNTIWNSGTLKDLTEEAIKYLNELL